MITTTKQQTIFEASYGNLKVMKFSTADEVEAEVEVIRTTFGFDKVEQDILLGLRSFDYTDLAAEQFSNIYDIAPGILIDILGN